MVFDLEGSEEITLPVLEAPAGYAVQLDDSGSGTRPFKWRYRWAEYPNGRGYSGTAQVYDFALALEGTFPDGDGDGMPDFWEDENAGLDKTDPLDAAQGANDGLFDNDGLTNLEEYQKGTDPNNVDSDADGINDGLEVSGSLNPFANAPTDPADDDSDNDGLLDGEEIVAGTDTFITNPNSNDTDSDTLLDAWEIENGFDPTDTTGDNGGLGDPDSDTLDNTAEMAKGTDPNNADTDADGYGDEVEDDTGTWVSATQTGTDPLLADSDGDLLSDGQENPDLAAHNPPTQYKTNPNIFDSDGDSVPDGVEVNHGTDPDDIADFPTDLGTYIQSVTNFNGVAEGISGTHVVGIPFGEDVPAYTDRTHEHNGITAAGLPLELLGGDYVMIGNNDRNKADYTTTVTLKADTAMYLLMDTRLVTATNLPAWMTDGVGLDFINTGLVTGLDENGNGVGPGVSIDQTFTVYLAQDTANGNTTTLVPGDYIFYEQQVVTRSMYAIVATDPASGIPLTITDCGFNAGAFELTVTGLKTYKQYVLARASDLIIGFTAIDIPFTPTSGTETLSDPTPSEGAAFYRVEEAN